jgi:hypothetical protein
MRVTTKVIDLDAHQSGEKLFGPHPLPDWVSVAEFHVERCTPEAPDVWPRADQTIDVDLELSFDGGATWQFAGHFGAFGGVHICRDGSVGKTSAGRMKFTKGAGRQVRGKLRVGNGPVHTSLSARLSDG